MKNAILLIRTPFQAWLAEKVILSEKPERFDLIYFTQNDSEEDHFYYQKLSRMSESSRIIFVKRQKFDFLNHLILAWRMLDFYSNKSYDAAILASLDLYAFNHIASGNKFDTIISFDDGSANFNKDSVYYKEPVSIRARFYRLLFGAVPVNQLKKKIDHHYTIHPEIDNIVQRDKLLVVPGWENHNKKTGEAAAARTFFIGAPFHETISPEKVKMFEAYVKSLNIDFYVKHPREVEPLDISAPFLDKQGRIAEEAILDAAAGKPFVVVGGLSSVMLNLVNCASCCTVLVSRESSKSNSLVNLIRESGCEISFFD